MKASTDDKERKDLREALKLNHLDKDSGEQ